MKLTTRFFNTKMSNIVTQGDANNINAAISHCPFLLIIFLIFLCIHLQFTIKILGIKSTFT